MFNLVILITSKFYTIWFMKPDVSSVIVTALTARHDKSCMVFDYWDIFVTASMGNRIYRGSRLGVINVQWTGGLCYWSVFKLIRTKKMLDSSCCWVTSAIIFLNILLMFFSMHQFEVFTLSLSGLCSLFSLDQVEMYHNYI